MNPTPTATELSSLLDSQLTSPPKGISLDSTLPAGLHPHSRERIYRLYVPAGFDTGKPSALLVVLHGCHQTHEDIQRISGFDTLADKQQFLVLYPYVTSYSGYRARECWGWWIKAHRTRGRGEVQDIWRIVEQVQRDYAIDASRLYVCGLSSGGAMAVNCLIAHPDRFSGGASVAGLAYGESPSAVKISAFSIPRYHSLQRLHSSALRNLAGAAPPNLLIIHSDGDQVVPEKATDSLELSWKQLANLDAAANEWKIAGEADDVPWTLTGHTCGNQPRLLRLDTPGFPHGWLGGQEGQHSSPEAPCVSALICWHMVASASRKRSRVNSAHSELLLQAS
ncbi:extracellular catalytic domain type 1 short-chain-length polyhydroxyalkanoate depolymerase [Granulosicoccus sp. 3-233]|uniref:extracellular catalytic domain type 1 short-chain-length polyhydroxyalkanoate depolymerase n=1 Tax=Granulosicoccus sp. 3-233 TaxID=3417969 RepID=UPI003D348E73